MTIKSYISVSCACLSIVSFGADAALVSRLGGLAYYDTNADLTWVADANLAQTSGYDTDGRMTHLQANNWAAQLNIAGVTGWRLADTLQPDPTCSNQSGGNSSNVFCTGSELGNMFYNVLGGVAGSSLTLSHNANYNLFSNIDDSTGYYWSSTELGPLTGRSWAFYMGFGNQEHLIDSANHYAWAVQSGDVSAVPVPAAAWLFGSGLLGLVNVARRKSANI